MSRHGRLLTLSALLVFASLILVGQGTPTTCPDSRAHLTDSAAALKPPDIMLTIASPHAGEMVPEMMPTQSLTITVDYRGPRLVAADTAHQVDEYHLVYFMDTDDSTYVGTASPTPRCNSTIVHTTSTSLTFDHIPHGPHIVYVMLVGANDISVNPPVAASASFVATEAH